MSARSWVEVSRSRLRHNLSAIRSLAPEKEVLAVVKANAYGHGIDLVAPLLEEEGVRSFAVADPHEGVRLRELLPDPEILVFGGCDADEFELFRRHRLSASVFDARDLPADIPVHLKINTGMGRLGFHWTQAPSILQSRRYNITGVFTTLACADTSSAFTEKQIERFGEATRDLSIRRHLSNSAGLQFPEARFDTIRPGLALYGIGLVLALNRLQPALTWKARIVAVNDLPEGSTVGYGGTFVTDRRRRIGVLGVGYADGYRRQLSNRGVVGTRSGLAPIVGRISMDLTMIDLSDLPEIRPGEEVTLLSPEPEDPHSAANLARSLETIPYEVLTTIGPRVRRVSVP